MANGQFQCFGNIQHLKSKYGKGGYGLVLKCRNDLITGELTKTRNQMYVNKVEEFMHEHVPTSILKDKQQNTLFYQIALNKSAMSIAQLFSLIETNKLALHLETYSLTQTSLEQVFIGFAKKQITNDNNLNQKQIILDFENDIQSDEMNNVKNNEYDDENDCKEIVIFNRSTKNDNTFTNVAFNHEKI